MVSVLMAVYNGEEHMIEAIESVLRQSYREIEMILVNDGSKDSSGTICDMFAKKDSRVRVIHKENGGLASARNTGIANASGDYFIMIDDDDYMLPNMLERMVQEIEKTNSDICVCDFFINEISGYETGEPVCYNKEQFMPSILTDEWQSMCWNKLIKKSCFDGIFFPENIVIEDLSTMHLIFNNATKVVKLKEKLYIYKESVLTGITNSTASKFVSSYHRAINFENRYYFSKEYYYGVAPIILKKAIRFYIASYLKSVFYNDHVIEQETIRNKLIILREEPYYKGNVAMYMLMRMIIKENSTIKFIAKYYMKKRYGIR